MKKTFHTLLFDYLPDFLANQYADGLQPNKKIISGLENRVFSEDDSGERVAGGAGDPFSGSKSRWCHSNGSKVNLEGTSRER